ncbi:MAG: ABC transporter permease [Candidatus Woesearchaeota archaeon]
MPKLLTIIHKNFKLIIRSRISALITIFGPLVITLLVGLAFNNAQMYSINIGVYATEYTSLVESYLSKLSEAQFQVIKLETQQSCEEDIRQGIINICMVFSENFKIADNQTGNELTFYVDPSQINLVYSVIDMISTRVEERSREISSELTTVILITLDNTRSTIEEQNPNFAEIIQNNEDISAKQQLIKTQLGNLNFEFNSNRFSVTSLKAINTALGRSAIGENSTMRDSVNRSIQLIDSIIDDIESSLLNGSPTESDVEALSKELEDIEEALKTVDEDALGELGDAILNIEKEVNATTQKFSDAKTARTEITRSISEITLSLQSTLTKAMAIKNDLNEIKKQIDTIQVTEAQAIVSPIKTRIEPIVSETYLNYMFPSLVAMVVMLISLLFAATVIVMEKKSNAYFRNLITPTRNFLFLLAAFISTLLLVALQVVLILSVSSFIFKVDIVSNVVPTSLVIMAITTLFTLLGILTGVMFTSAETATLAAVSGGSLLIFLSDIILPLESMPRYLQEIARFNPFVVAEVLLRKSILFKAPIQQLFTSHYFSIPVSGLVVLLGYIAVCILGLTILDTIIMKHLVKKTLFRFTHKPDRVVDVTDQGTDPLAKTDSLIQIANDLIKQRDYKQARLVYANLNELYAVLPLDKKKDYFKKIVEIHKQLDQKN